jgi:hypothetical protein
MLGMSKFSFNNSAIIIWLTLGMTSVLYLALFLIAIAMNIKNHKNANTITKTQNHDQNHLYENILIQPLAIQNQN